MLADDSDFTKDSIAHILRETKNSKVQENCGKQYFKPAVRVSIPSKLLTDGPFKNILHYLENMAPNEELKYQTLNIPTGSLFRLKKTSQEFIQGAQIITDLPDKNDLTLYYKSLIMGVRFLFCAFSGNSFFSSKGGRYNACTAKAIPEFDQTKVGALMSAVFVEIPVTFFPKGFSFRPEEICEDSWSIRMLDRWRKSMEQGNWSKPLKETTMGTALEAEVIIMSLYVSACFAKCVNSTEEANYAAGVLLAKCHDLLCGLVYLLGIQKIVMPGMLSSGKFHPDAVKIKCAVTPTLSQVLNPNFLVRLMLDMAQAFMKQKERINDALQVVSQCQSFGSPLWDAEARFTRGQILITQLKFKEAECEFEKCITRIGVNDPNFTASCYYELILSCIYGSKGKTFNVGHIRELYSKAMDFELKEYKIWGEGETCASQSYELVKMIMGLIHSMKISDERQIMSAGYKLKEGKLTVPIKLVVENGTPCNCCGYSVEPMLRCSRCKSNEYYVCGIDCQKKDWINHKSRCQIPKLK